MSADDVRLTRLLDEDIDGALRHVLVLAFISDDDRVIWDEPAEVNAADADYDAAKVQQFMDLVRDLHREALTDLALSMSLCPIHLVDYAICFDDEDADCAQVRRIHPSHDT